MRSPSRTRSRLVPGLGSIVLCSLLLGLLAAPVDAHESRQVGDYTVEVGFIGEPVYVGEKSGLELQVTRGGIPVAGLDRTLKAEVRYASASLPLTLEPVVTGGPGYTATFIPTAAGAYTFHLTGTIESTSIDESFTSSPTGFDEVREAASGQFPVALPTVAELAAESKRGADAAALVPVALAVGAAGLVIGLVGLGVALGGRRRRGTAP